MKVLQKIILDISTQVNVLLLSYIDLHHTLALSIKLTSLLERESEREYKQKRMKEQGIKSEYEQIIHNRVIARYQKAVIINKPPLTPIRSY